MVGRQDIGKRLETGERRVLSGARKSSRSRAAASGRLGPAPASAVQHHREQGCRAEAANDRRDHYASADVCRLLRESNLALNRQETRTVLRVANG
jgi:hypothetical protein